MIRLSIVTAVLNAAGHIEDCLQSLAGQTYPFEHIVIDGGSSDGSVAIIRRYHRQPSFFVSEPDRGLYDALNKGIQRATGDIIGILHADDLLADKEVLATIARRFEDTTIDACYGDLVYIDRHNPSRVVRYWHAQPYHRQRFYSGWMPPHPTFFVRRTIYQRYGDFNLQLGSAADYELMLRFLFKYRIMAHYIPRVLVKMRTGGLSNASWGNRWKAHCNDHRAWRINGLRPKPWTLWLKPLSKITQYRRYRSAADELPRGDAQ